MTGARQRVIVAGGGIAGLAAAIACSRADLSVIVFEQANELTEVGAALTLWPNGVLALRRLGVTPPTTEPRITTLRMRRAGGGDLATISTSFLERDGGQLLALHRAELVELLRQELGASALALGSALTSFRQRDGEVEAKVRRRNGSSMSEVGDVLVGADGIDSTVRSQLLGDSAARPVNAKAWRGVTSVPEGVVPRDEANQVWGSHGEFGWIPLGDGTVYWFAALRLPSVEPPGTNEHKDWLIGRCGHWAPPVSDLIASTPPDAITFTELRTRRVPWRWSRGRVVLIGDAAHAMAPNLGQGACQALEDAVALGRALANHGGTARALRSFARARVARAKLVSTMSQVTGALLYVGDERLLRARDAALSAAPEALLRQPVGLASRSRRLVR